ncbi:RHS repeat domain-containing protein [Zobellia laminariae]|uniref:RHS repeat-associated core domain-containing protein n=1 Tax=Zobellia laminariae TaxID=248906 RepID=UPI0012D8E3E4|nr:hypothetical protein [Zobellia laminariae]
MYTAKHKLNFSSIVILALILLAFTQTLRAQSNCYGATGSDFVFTSAGGTQSRTIQAPNNCSGGTWTVIGKPSWVSKATISGTTVTVTVPSYSGAEQNGSVYLANNGNSVGGIAVYQNKGSTGGGSTGGGGTPACSITGFGGGGEFSRSGEERVYNLKYSSGCPSRVFYTFKAIENNTTEVDLPSWIQVTQNEPSKTVTVKFAANTGTSIRNLVIIGKRQDGGTPGIGNTFTQQCVEKNWYSDSDGDGLRDPGSTVVKDCASVKAGYTIGTTVDVCPNVANTLEENEIKTWYKDSDGDGYPNPNAETRSQCTKPSGGWTSSPRTLDDLCPDYANNEDGSNGCNISCLPYTVIPSIIEFDSSGGEASAKINLSCASGSGYHIEIDIPSVAQNWLTITRNNMDLVISCDPGTESNDITVPIRINGNSQGGLRVRRNYSSTTPTPNPTPTTCKAGGVDDLTFNAEGGSEEFTITFNPVSCAETVYLKAVDGGSLVDLPAWLNDRSLSGNTFELSPNANTTGAARSVILVTVDGNGQGVGSFNFNVSQPSCNGIIWYPDTDGDTFGDVYSVGESGCSRPDYGDGINWVENNSDLCPNVKGTKENNGCPAGNEIPENFNTITTKLYAINDPVNPKAASKSYFNDLGKPTQSQSLDIETNRIWASEIRYDSEGRPAIQTLSAPTELSTFTYKDKFFLNSSGVRFGSDDIASDSKNPETVSANENTLGWYYSDANDSEAYQDVTDRPYSRAVYSTLNPGSILRTVGGNKVDSNKDGKITAVDNWPESHTFSMRASKELSNSAAFGSAKYDGYKISKTVNRSVNGIENVVFTDSDGKTLAAARSGGATSRSMNISIGEQGFVDIHVPSGNNMGFTVTAGGNTIKTYNLVTEEDNVTPSSSLTNGFYRVAVQNPDTYVAGTASVNYKENYYDYSLNEYDDAGRLKTSFQPLNKLRTDYLYNTFGQLIKITSPDEGTSEFKYRNDGQIRYSQNSEQAKVNEVSFTDYDVYARPIVSGVLMNVNFAGLDADGPLPLGAKKEVVTTEYDVVLKTLTCRSAICNAIITLGGQRFVSGNVSNTNNDQNTTYYSYDVYGRVKWIVQEILGLGVKTINYEYEPITGLVKRVIFQNNNLAERFIHRYSYNVKDQLVLVETSKDDSSYTIQAQYEYFETGGLKRTILAEGAQSIDYVYNLVGQLKSINHPDLAQGGIHGTDTNPDLFGMQIDYHSFDYSRTQKTNITSPTYGTDQLNGNIKGVRWQNNGESGQEAVYAYEYNRNNWLTGADYGADGVAEAKTADPLILSNEVVNSGEEKTYENPVSISITDSHFNSGSTVLVTIGGGSTSGGGAYDVSGITYDANGNIQSLVRNKDNADNGVAMDNLKYVYKEDKPNQLLRVEDSAGEVVGAEDIGTQTSANYEYNLIGQLTRNISEDISYFYNASGLVSEVQKGNRTLVKFYYNDRNHRVRKETYAGSGTNVVETTYYVRDVSGQVMGIYTEDITNPLAIRENAVYGQSRIGVYKRGATKDITYYELTDHLGNVRTVFSKEETVAANFTDYYPFGMPMPGRNLVGDYRYAFQGQEKDSETGKEAFELRLWDSRIGRWLGPDPYGEFSSPYLGMGNNPINLIDPNGGMTDDCCDEWYSNVENQLDEVVVTAPRGGPSWTTEITERYGYGGTMGQWKNEFNLSALSDASARRLYEDFARSAWTQQVAAWDKAEQNRVTLEKLGIFLSYTAPVSEAFLYAYPAGGLFKSSAPKIFSYTPRVQPPVAKIHGNSLLSPKPTWSYKLYSNSGEFLKNGITSKLTPQSRYTKSFMADKFMDDLILHPNRRAAYDFEYLQNTIQRGPLNKNMH